MVGPIVLSREARMNTINVDMLEELEAALGGGLELAACADLRIASERSEHNLGLPERIIGMGRAKEVVSNVRVREL